MVGDLEFTALSLAVIILGFFLTTVENLAVFGGQWWICTSAIRAGVDFLVLVARRVQQQHQQQHQQQFLHTPLQHHPRQNILATMVATAATKLPAAFATRFLTNQICITTVVVRKVTFVTVKDATITRFSILRSLIATPGRVKLLMRASRSQTPLLPGPLLPLLLPPLQPPLLRPLLPPPNIPLPTPLPIPVLPLPTTLLRILAMMALTAATRSMGFATKSVATSGLAPARCHTGAPKAVGRTMSLTPAPCAPLRLLLRLLLRPRLCWICLSACKQSVCTKR